MMSAKPSDVRPLQDPEGPLERALIEEFLRAQGYDSQTLEGLPEDQSKQLREEASVYASGKLAEIEARAHFLREIHRED